MHKFNGMFAFAIWKRDDNTLFLARDRYGIIPLYYYKSSKCLIFGSEIKSIILHPDVEVNVSINALNEYFTFQNVLSELTLFDKIKILEAGTTITFKSDGNTNKFKKIKYWDFDFKRTIPCLLENAMSK